jgi:hypothetical protein
MWWSQSKLTVNLNRHISDDFTDIEKHIFAMISQNDHAIIDWCERATSNWYSTEEDMNLKWKEGSIFHRLKSKVPDQHRVFIIVT